MVSSSWVKRLRYKGMAPQIKTITVWRREEMTLAVIAVGGSSIYLEVPLGTDRSIRCRDRSRWCLHLRASKRELSSKVGGGTEP